VQEVVLLHSLASLRIEVISVRHVTKELLLAASVASDILPSLSSLVPQHLVGECFICADFLSNIIERVWAKVCHLIILGIVKEKFPCRSVIFISICDIERINAHRKRDKEFSVKVHDGELWINVFESSQRAWDESDSNIRCFIVVGFSY